MGDFHLKNWPLVTFRDAPMGDNDKTPCVQVSLGRATKYSGLARKQLSVIGVSKKDVKTEMIGKDTKIYHVGQVAIYLHKHGYPKIAIILVNRSHD